jgi:hypothetical protein
MDRVTHWNSGNFIYLKFVLGMENSDVLGISLEPGVERPADGAESFQRWG